MNTTPKTKLIPFTIERWKAGRYVGIQYTDLPVRKIWLREHDNYPLIVDVGHATVYCLTADGREHINLVTQPSHLKLVIYDDTDPLDEICEGHNPGRLTRRQVETDKGWRLLEREEISENRRSIEEIYAWEVTGFWSKVMYHGDCVSITYRTRKPPGYFLPKPRRTRHLRAADWDGLPVIWFRWIATVTPCEFLVVCITDLEEFRIGDVWYSFAAKETLSNAEWSTDRVNWKPFTVEEAPE